MAVKIVSIPELGEIRLVKNSRSRSVKISLGAGGVVSVSLPPWVPYQAAIQFALSKKAWILENKQSSELLEHGMNIGKQHTLYMRKDQHKNTVSTRLGNSLLTVTHPSHLEWDSAEVQKAARAAAQKALKKQAEALLPARLQELADEHNFTFQSVSVRQLKARWGSCNNKQEIVLNYYLMQLPWALIDYVLLHELAHTKALHHGPDFWAIFESVLPGAKQRRKGLKEYKPAI